MFNSSSYRRRSAFARRMLAVITAAFILLQPVLLIAPAAAQWRRGGGIVKPPAPVSDPLISVTTLGTPITQNFDTLPASGSTTWVNDSTLPGWYHARTGTGTTIVANDGSSNAGNLYSYGTGTATDRALGSLGSGNAAIGNLFWGIRLTNNTGVTITRLDVSYTGEQWRNSAAAAQTVSFSYLVGSPTVTGSLAEFQSAGVAVPQLDFTSPITGGAAGALDGNLAANRVTLTHSITGLNIPNGTDIMLRWSDPDHTGADHGLSIDDFSVTPLGTGGTPPGLGDVKISEFRYNGPNGALDEYVELYNNTNAQITVGDSGAGTGWAIVTSDNTSTAKAVIPNGMTIPARGHLLVTNSGGYSLGQYPSGNNGVSATLATGDITYTTDIPINTGIALFRTTISANFNSGEQLDAVGPASVSNTLYKEGTGLPDIAAIASDYAWVRRWPGGCTGTQPGFVNHNCTSAALVASTAAPSSTNHQDTGNNITDFIFVDINGTATPVGNQRLGAPGPQNSTSPLARDSAPITSGLIDPMQASSAPPNRVRDPSSGTNALFGTMDIRRRFTNNTGAPITRLRFRIVDVSTFPALDDVGTTNDAADLRALTSLDATVTITGGSMLTVRGTTLEQDTSGNPGQPVGGAFNSSLSAGTVTLGTPLAHLAWIDVRFVFGVMQNGKFRVFVIVEALP